MATNKRDIGLDILRIMLCAGVTIYHFTPERPASGSFMVLGFFVLSGYLLGRRFFTCNELDVCTFYRDKFIRLVPMFMAALLFGVLITSIKDITGANSLFPLPDISYAYFNPATFVAHYNSPCWYIIVLLALMSIAPLFFFFSRYKYGLISAISFVLLMSILIHSQLPHYHKGPYYMPLVRSWQFMAGMLAAQMELQYFSEKTTFAFLKKPTLVLCSAIFVSASVALCIAKQDAQLHGWNFSLPFNCASVVLFACLIPLLFNSGLKWKYGRFISFLAVLSYPFYLIHVPVKSCIHWLAPHLATVSGIGFLASDLTIAVFATIGSFMAAYLMLKYQTLIEKKYFKRW